MIETPLLDRLRRERRVTRPRFIEPDKRDAWEHWTEQMFGIIANPEMPRARIDSVVEHYFAENLQEYWDLARDFPSFAPGRSDVLWCESPFPSLIQSAKKGISKVPVKHGRFAILLFWATRENTTGEGIPYNAAWILVAELFIDYGISKYVEGPHGAWTFAIDAQGKIIDRPYMQSFAASEFAEHMQHLLTYMHPALLALDRTLMLKAGDEIEL